MKNRPLPKVSVCMITYNHAPFVAQALESILTQVVDFPYEIVIGEDCSSDDTAAIVERYRSKFPLIIRVLDRSTNLGLKQNFIQTLLACQGTYVALLEGDDFWTDPRKLAKQVAFLDENLEFMGCASRVEEYRDGLRTAVYPEHCPEIVTLNDLLTTNPFHTCSVVYRRVFPPLPEWFGKMLVGDWPLHIIHAQTGPFRFFPEVTASYRVHPLGAWSALSRIRRTEQIVSMFDTLLKNFDPKYALRLERGRNYSLFCLAYYHADEGDTLKARAIVRTLPLFSDARPNVSLIGRCSILAYAYTPRLFVACRWMARKLFGKWVTAQSLPTRS